MLFQDFSAHLSDSECGNFKMSGSHKLGEISFWKWFKITTLLKALSFLATVHKVELLSSSGQPCCIPHILFKDFCVSLCMLISFN